jgi:hypothetical protein
VHGSPWETEPVLVPFGKERRLLLPQDPPIHTRRLLRAPGRRALLSPSCRRWMTWAPRRPPRIYPPPKSRLLHQSDPSAAFFLWWIVAFVCDRAAICLSYSPVALSIHGISLMGRGLNGSCCIVCLYSQGEVLSLLFPAELLFLYGFDPRTQQNSPKCQCPFIFQTILLLLL